MKSSVRSVFHTPSKGLFTWREEDATTRMILEDGKTLLWVYMKNFGPCGAQVDKVREGSKSGGRQKQKCNLGPSSCKRLLNLPRVVKLCLPTLFLCISLTVY